MAYEYIYGPIASRRLGQSLGVAPIKDNVCNYNCVYCQLGEAKATPNQRFAYFSKEAILSELDKALDEKANYDAISIVGDGEPTLHQDLGEIVRRIKKKSQKPLVLVTNGRLLDDPKLLDDIADCDIVMPSLDAYDEASYRRINRPVGNESFADVLNNLSAFCANFGHQIWLEIMLVAGYNDSLEALEAFQEILATLRYDRLYLNTVVRPPRNPRAKAVSSSTMRIFSETLNGIPLDYLSKESYQSVEKDTYNALIALLKRHPLHRHEIKTFLKNREENAADIFKKLDEDKAVVIKPYGPYDVYCYNTPE